MEARTVTRKGPMATKTKAKYRRLWLLVADEDRETLRDYAENLGRATAPPSKVSLNYAGAVLLRHAIRNVREIRKSPG